jgi:hypothetical protein
MRVPGSAGGSGGRLVSVVLAAVMLVGWSLPAHAAGAGSTAVCLVNVSETFTTALMAASEATANLVTGNGSSTSCTGLSSNSVTFTWSSPTIGGTTCAGPLAGVAGSGTVTPPGGGTSVIAAGGGSPAGQIWVFVDQSGSANVDAIGFFAWTRTDEIQKCAMASLGTTIHLSGVLIIVY